MRSISSLDTPAAHDAGIFIDKGCKLVNREEASSISRPGRRSISSLNTPAAMQHCNSMFEQEASLQLVWQPGMRSISAVDIPAAHDPGILLLED
jgi:hypothetical protein